MSSRRRAKRNVCGANDTRSARACNSCSVRRCRRRRGLRNASLGAAGEKFVFEVEHQRLWEAGKRRLAEKTEHVAATQGDGLGYDIASSEGSGRERFIEVKTTRFGARTALEGSRAPHSDCTAGPKPRQYPRKSALHEPKRWVIFECRPSSGRAPFVPGSSVPRVSTGRRTCMSTGDQRRSW